MTLPKKDRSAQISKSLETRKRHPIHSIDSRRYVQHNVLLGDGLGPILQFMDELPPDRTRVDVLRAIEDGEYSALHVDYVLGDWGPMVGFEVHRWEDDRIVEHWDNLQPKAAGANPSGRTMVDGAAEIGELERTAENKALVETFVSRVLIGGDLEALPVFFEDSALIQHSPACADGTQALAASLADNRASGAAVHHRLRLLLGEGDFVLAASEGAVHGEPAAFYDLFRTFRGVIAEHWDVVEIIAPKAAWKNANGKF